MNSQHNLTSGDDTTALVDNKNEDKTEDDDMFFTGEPLPQVNISRPQINVPNKIKLAAQSLFGLVFGGANTLIFLKPSQNYANQSDFAIRISNFIGTSSWPLFFASSVSDFGLVSLYFSAMSIPAYIEFIREQPNFSTKLLKGGGLLILTATQNVQPLLITLASHSPPLIVAAATIGEFPRNLYSAMNIKDVELPMLISSIRKILLPLQIITSPNYFVSSEDSARNHFIYKISQLQDEFLNRIQAGWLHILNKSDRALSAINFATLSEPEIWLSMLENISPKDDTGESVPSQILRKIFHLLGVSSAINLLLPVWLNANKICAAKYGDYFGGFAAMATSVFATYLFNKFNVTGFDVSYDALKNTLQKKPIDNLSLAFMPKTMIAATFSSFIISLLSYPTILSLHQENYSGSFKDELTISLIFFININHAIGLIKLTNLAIMSYTQSYSDSPKNQALLKINAAKMQAENLAKLDNAEEFFRFFSTHSSDNKNKFLGEKGAKTFGELSNRNNQYNFFQTPTALPPSVTPEIMPKPPKKTCQLL